MLHQISCLLFGCVHQVTNLDRRCYLSSLPGSALSGEVFKVVTKRNNGIRSTACRTSTRAPPKTTGMTRPVSPSGRYRCGRLPRHARRLAYECAGTATSERPSVALGPFRSRPSNPRDARQPPLAQPKVLSVHVTVPAEFHDATAQNLRG